MKLDELTMNVLLGFGIFFNLHLKPNKSSIKINEMTG